VSYKANFKVWRGDDETGSLQDYVVEVNEGEVVLDIIHRLQATQAPDLASAARAPRRSTASRDCCA
jgi:succinate dehydrogenase / fumarate reductase iron-sulfur subunit